ncbi:MAG TPA: response regulator, partial [Bacteroidetes bacterium]|nr:response regulator [Bacteroidota bacterium]HEX03939.1 response regulator [Bacteroidota bacterium]
AVANITEVAITLDSVEELCAHIHQQIGKLLDARNFFVALYNPERDTYTFPYMIDLYDVKSFPKTEEFKVPRSLTDYVRRTGKPQMIDIPSWEQLARQGEVELVGAQSYLWMGVPLKTRQGVIGVVVIQTYDPEVIYTDEHFNLMIRVSEQIGHAVERKRSEQTLRASEHRNRTLLGTMPDLMLVIDKNGRYLDYHCPESYELRTPPEKIVGNLVSDVLQPDTTILFLERIKKTVDTGEIQVFEYSMNLGQENEGYFEARMLLLNDSEVMVLIREITIQKKTEKESKALESQMQHAQKLESLGVLAGGIAHDFNNLLVGILGNANLAITRMDEDHSERGLIDNIQTAAQRASELTRQMLAYSGKGSFIIEPMDLSKAIEEMYNLLKVSISRHCELDCDYSDDVPMVNGDATQIRQVVMNLITNASDAIGDNVGTITIRTGRMELTKGSLGAVYLDKDLEEGLYSYVEVSDTGCGMDKETIDKMFDPFFTTKFTGRGLGLAAVLGILRSHKGMFKVYSELGKGTTIRALLPASDQQVIPDDSKTDQIELNTNASGTVLVVDDDETVRQVAEMMLQGFGYTVRTAVDGMDACELYTREGESIDLVILDMSMPRMDGEETFNELKKIDADVRVMLSSGYNEQETMSDFDGDGLCGFIQKPYQMSELILQVQESLSKSVK